MLCLPRRSAVPARGGKSYRLRDLLTPPLLPDFLTINGFTMEHNINLNCRQCRFFIPSIEVPTTGLCLKFPDAKARDTALPGHATCQRFEERTQ